MAQKVKIISHTRESEQNDTQTPLGAGGVFTGEWEDTSSYHSIQINVFSPTAMTLDLMFSDDRINTDFTTSKTVVAGVANTFNVPIERKYFKLEMTNNGGVQGFLRTRAIYLDYFNTMNSDGDVRVTLDGEVVDVGLVAGTPNIINLSVPTAATEVSQVLSDNTKRLEIRARQTNAQLQFAFTATESGTKFLTIPAATTYSLDGLDLDSTTLFIQSDKNATIVEILEFI